MIFMKCYMILYELVKIYKNKSKNNINRWFQFLVRTISKMFVFSFSIELNGILVRQTNLQKTCNRFSIQIEIWQWHDDFELILFLKWPCHLLSFLRGHMSKCSGSLFLFYFLGFMRSTAHTQKKLMYVIPRLIYETVQILGCVHQYDKKFQILAHGRSYSHFQYKYWSRSKCK